MRGLECSCFLRNAISLNQKKYYEVLHSLHVIPSALHRTVSEGFECLPPAFPVSQTRVVAMSSRSIMALARGITAAAAVSVAPFDICAQLKACHSRTPSGAASTGSTPEASLRLRRRLSFLLTAGAPDEDEAGRWLDEELDLCDPRRRDASDSNRDFVNLCEMLRWLAVWLSHTPVGVRASLALVGLAAVEDMQQGTLSSSEANRLSDCLTEAGNPCIAAFNRALSLHGRDFFQASMTFDAYRNYLATMAASAADVASRAGASKDATRIDDFLAASDRATHDLYAAQLSLDHARIDETLSAFQQWRDAVVGDDGELCDDATITQAASTVLTTAQRTLAASLSAIRMDLETAVAQPSPESFPSASAIVTAWQRLATHVASCHTCDEEPAGKPSMEAALYLRAVGNLTQTITTAAKAGLPMATMYSLASARRILALRLLEAAWSHREATTPVSSDRTTIPSHRLHVVVGYPLSTWEAATLAAVSVATCRWFQQQCEPKCCEEVQIADQLASEAPLQSSFKPFAGLPEGVKPSEVAADGWPSWVMATLVFTRRRRTHTTSHPTSCIDDVLWWLSATQSLLPTRSAASSASDDVALAVDGLLALSHVDLLARRRVDDDDDDDQEQGKRATAAAARPTSAARASSFHHSSPLHLQNRLSSADLLRKFWQRVPAKRSNLSVHPWGMLCACVRLAVAPSDSTSEAGGSSSATPPPQCHEDDTRLFAQVASQVGPLAPGVGQSLAAALAWVSLLGRPVSDVHVARFRFFAWACATTMAASTMTSLSVPPPPLSLPHLPPDVVGSKRDRSASAAHPITFAEVCKRGVLVAGFSRLDLKENPMSTLDRMVRDAFHRHFSGSVVVSDVTLLPMHAAGGEATSDDVLQLTSLSQLDSEAAQEMDVTRNEHAMRRRPNAVIVLLTEAGMASRCISVPVALDANVVVTPRALDPARLLRATAPPSHHDRVVPDRHAARTGQHAADAANTPTTFDDLLEK